MAGVSSPKPVTDVTHNVTNGVTNRRELSAAAGRMKKWREAHAEENREKQRERMRKRRAAARAGLAVA